jgi:hypothetical protein
LDGDANETISFNNNNNNCGKQYRGGGLDQNPVRKHSSLSKFLEICVQLINENKKNNMDLKEL